VLLAATASAYAERTVRGSVTDQATGQPIADAFVSVGGAEATTDADGTFRLEKLPFGRLDVLVIADGYGEYFGATTTGSTLTVRLAAATGSRELIRVSGRAPLRPPLQLGTEQIRTQPGAGNDVLRALQSLPGVSRTPYGLGGLALRGTAPRDTKVYLDDVEVPLLYHFGGLASFLPTGATAAVTLQPGGARVRYGRGLGGVATVESRTGRRDHWRVGGELSLIHAAALAEGDGWLVGVRRSYFDAIIAAASIDLALLPRYGDAQVRWESDDGRWMGLLFASDDRVELATNDDSTGGIDTSNVQSFLYTQRFVRLAARYRAIAGPTTVLVVPSIGVDDIEARAVHKMVDKGMHRVTVPLAVRAEVATAVLGGTLTSGVDVSAAWNSYDMLNTPPPTPMDPSPDTPIQRSLERWALDAGAYIEQSWFVLDDRVAIRPGLRGDRFGLSEQWTLDPRLTIDAQLQPDLSLVVAAGRYHAPPLVTDLDPIFGERRMLGSAATSGAVTLKRVVGDIGELAATAYAAKLSELPVDAVSSATPISDSGGTESGGLFGISRELVDAQFGSYSYREAIGAGHAYGLELIARKNVGAWTGWVAYTYARAFRRNPTRGDVTTPYVLDQPHSLTAVGTYAISPRWRVGARVRYATGNPYTPVAAAYREDDGGWVPLDGPTLSERLPDFFQLDLRVDRTWRRPWGVMNLYVDVQNVLNRKNAEGITYNADFSRGSYTRGLPIFPSIGVEYIP